MEKEIQVCPLCKGKGTLPTGFYGNPGCSQGDVMQNKFPATCRVCFGKGVIEIEKEEKNEKPAHIDWEAWEPCELCKRIDEVDPCYKDGCFRENASACDFRCDKFLEWRADRKRLTGAAFCPKCGRPLTEEAKAELEKRLRG